MIEVGVGGGNHSVGHGQGVAIGLGRTGGTLDHRVDVTALQMETGEEIPEKNFVPVPPRTVQLVAREPGAI